ncbi:MAG: hypothetical protein AABY04_00630, partial [Candidatus Micrarchaeota archaeon]
MRRQGKLFFWQIADILFGAWHGNPSPCIIFKDDIFMKTGSEIQSLRRLLIGLEQASRKNDAPIWKKAAFYLGKPTRQRIEVNLHRISRFSKN